VLPTPDKTFRLDQPKNSAAGEKIRPPTKSLTNTDITVFLHTISLGKGTEKSKISGDKVYFSADILRF
jgi:hypothetical protein